MCLDVPVEQGFVQPFDFLRGRLEQFQKDADGGGHPLVGGGFGQSVIGLKRLDVGKRCDRAEIDLLEQGGIDALTRLYGLRSAG